MNKLVEVKHIHARFTKNAKYNILESCFLINKYTKNIKHAVPIVLIVLPKNAKVVLK